MNWGNSEMIGFALIIVSLLVVSGLFVASVLFLTGYALSEVYAFFPLTSALGEVTWSASVEFTLVAVPLFILMGQILLRTGVTESLYIALGKWLNWLPGGLMHTNIAAAAMFAATSGSSVATAATIGTVSLPNMRRYDYHEPLFLGTVAAGGTLGILIPPSINMVLYALLSETSILDLYLAAAIPGILLAVLFSGFVLVICILFPKFGGRHESAPWAERIKGLIHLIPVLFLFLIVVGSIYAGVATPTEAAALGVVASLAIGWGHGSLTLRPLIAALVGTMRTTCMIMLIFICAVFLSFCMSNTGLTSAITGTITSLDFSPVGMLFAIVVFYLILGCFMDPISMMMATAPVIVPVIAALGYDLVWWGVVFMILTEAALITPPIGVNLFVVQSVRRDGSLKDVIFGSIPFLVLMLLMIALLVAFPQIAMWLPELFKVK
jgi:C4-dicarboxylate transporter DctM subunit